MRTESISRSFVYCFMACVAGSLFFSMSNEAEAQVTYTFSGIANNLGASENPFVGLNEPYTATFVVDQSVADSDPSSLRGEYAGAIISSSIKFVGGYSSMVDFAGGDVIVHEANPGGGFSFDAPGMLTGGIILYSADNIPFESDSLQVDPGVIPMQTGFWSLPEPNGIIVSFSDLSRPPVAFSITTAFVPPTLYGDVDRNGEVNFSDIPPFINVLTGDGYQAEVDCNEDGFISFGDIPPFIVALTNQ